MRLPAADALRAAGVSRVWQAAARSVENLSFTVSLHAHKPVPTAEAPWVHTASGLSCLRGCSQSPAAAQLSELELFIDYSATPLKETIQEPSYMGDFSGRLPPLRFPALQQLSVCFLPRQGIINNAQVTVMTYLTGDLVSALLCGCPQLRQVSISLTPTRSLHTFIKPGRCIHGSSLPLERILDGAVPALQTVTVRDDGGELFITLKSLPWQGPQPSLSLVICAPTVHFADVADDPGYPAFLPALDEEDVAQRMTLQTLEVQTQRLNLEHIELLQLQRFQEHCRAMLIRGPSSVQRPELVLGSDRPRRDETRALLEAVMHTTP